MKGLNSCWQKALLLSCVVGCVLPAPAQIFLTEGNTSVSINPNSDAGMYNWTVNGVDHLNSQWFWYRIGSTGPESAINTLSAPSVVTPAADEARITYANSLFSVEVSYQLAAGAPGSYVSAINETILIQNLSGSPLSLSFFQYSDFDLGGTPGGDNVAIGSNLAGLFNEAYQWDDSILLQEDVGHVSGTVAPGANHAEAALFPSTLNSLNDLSTTTLNDATGPIGPGDVTWAFQWDLMIDANGSATISKLKSLTVPEPSSMALLGLGALALAFRRRT